jgi:hypothetical protein
VWPDNREYPLQSSQTPWINFFIESKHPPSLTFHLFNMAWAIVLLVVVKLLEDRLKNTFIGWSLTTLGQTALFFFVAHMLLYSGAARLLGETVRIPSTWFGGHNLPPLFLELALSMVILVPLCAIYRNLRRTYSILSYL